MTEDASVISLSESLKEIVAHVARWIFCLISWPHHHASIPCLGCRQPPSENRHSLQTNSTQVALAFMNSDRRLPLRFLIAVHLKQFKIFGDWYYEFSHSRGNNRLTKKSFSGAEGAWWEVQKEHVGMDLDWGWQATGAGGGLRNGWIRVPGNGRCQLP